MQPHLEGSFRFYYTQFFQWATKKSKDQEAQFLEVVVVPEGNGQHVEDG